MQQLHVLLAESGNRWLLIIVLSYIPRFAHCYIELSLELQMLFFLPRKSQVRSESLLSVHCSRCGLQPRTQSARLVVHFFLFFFFLSPVSPKPHSQQVHVLLLTK